MLRLTFVGDIALDKPLLKAAKARGNGKYDFSDVFHTENVFRDSDLVVGNLETVFGGGHRFNKKPYHYNSPDSFCQAIKNAGIDLVSTANNHCMDEGVHGLCRTLKVLDDAGIAYTGTYADDTEDRFLVREIKSVKIAFYALTYSVNVGMESLDCEDLYRHINLIGFSGKIHQIKKKCLHQSTIAAHTDTISESKMNQSWMADIEKQVKKAKEQADYLVVLLHIGGQFNTEPGTFSTYMVEKLLSLGTDVIIGNHPHTVQRVEANTQRIVAYSLGGYCMSTSGEYLVHECLPEYSLARHVDIDEKSRALNCSADVLKGTEDENGYLTVAKATDSQAETIRLRSRI